VFSEGEQQQDSNSVQKRPAAAGGGQETDQAVLGRAGPAATVFILLFEDVMVLDMSDMAHTQIGSQTDWLALWQVGPEH
jgi:hypothetical protein